MLTISLPSKKKCKIDKEYLKEIVEKISFPRPFGTASNKKASNLIVEEFNKIGLTPQIVGDYENICAGCDLANAEILIGAHFDSVPRSPAADDNASAVAVMLACAKELKNYKNISFVAFNCEEYGIKGSQDLVKNNLKINKLKQVHVLEMVGYRSYAPNSQSNPLYQFIEIPTTGDFIGAVGNNSEIISKIIEKSNTVSIPVVSLEIPQNLNEQREMTHHLFRSDHIGFWDKKIPAVLWTDTAEFRNPNYHQTTDTPDTLDYDFMAEITQLIVNICKG